jgi:uncharacterized protein with HEPN domain
MQDEANFILNHSRTLTKDQFLKDEVLKRALARSIEIVGEAAKNVPLEFRNQHPEIAWRSITGMRDHLIHGYITIDLDIVWDVVTKGIPELSQQLRAILEQPETPTSPPNTA